MLPCALFITSGSFLPILRGIPFIQDLEPLVKFDSRYRVFRVYITVFITTGLISTGVITTDVLFRHSVVQTVLDARAGFDLARSLSSIEGLQSLHYWRHHYWRHHYWRRHYWRNEFDTLVVQTFLGARVRLRAS